MTHPDLDKLEADLLAMKSPLSCHNTPDSVIKAACAHLAAQRQGGDYVTVDIPRKYFDEYKSVCLEITRDGGFIIDAPVGGQSFQSGGDDYFYNRDAQRQRGDEAIKYFGNDPEGAHWAEDNPSVVTGDRGDAGGMPERIWINDEYLPGCFQKRPAWPGSGKDVQYIRADLAHPPAVTDDRGALDALDRLHANAEYNGCLQDKRIVRAALLSAQTGVPGEVVEVLRRLSKLLRHSPDPIPTDERYALADIIDEALQSQVPQAGVPGKFKLGARVTKIKGSKWSGRVVGFYSTELTPVGYAVESETETGSVQIYPEAALAYLTNDERSE